MSFILDALKKSETDRQQQGSAEFAGVPTSSGPAGAPRWLWILGLLLAINLAVLLGLLLRPDAVEPPLVQSNTQTVAPPAPAVSTPMSADEASFVDRVAEARQNAPPRQEPPPATGALPQPSTELPAPIPERRIEPADDNAAALPTVMEVIANGTIELPDLHLDIHVYSDMPEDRFVFINMSKQREHSQLREGPVVEEITPYGVVLEYLGTKFLLPRD